MTQLRITRELEYLDGHLRYGYQELYVDKEKWEKMTDDEKKDFFSNESEIVASDYEINDYAEDLNSEMIIEEEK